MAYSKTNRSYPPGEELLKNYHSWKRKVPELQNLILDPKWSYAEITIFKDRIRRMLSGIESFEKIFPNYKIHDRSNSKICQVRGVQQKLF